LNGCRLLPVPIADPATTNLSTDFPNRKATPQTLAAKYKRQANTLVYGMSGEKPRRRPMPRLPVVLGSPIKGRVNRKKHLTEGIQRPVSRCKLIVTHCLRLCFQPEPRPGFQTMDRVVC